MSPHPPFPELPQQDPNHASHGPKGSVGLGRREGEWETELKPTLTIATSIHSKGPQTAQR